MSRVLIVDKHASHEMCFSGWLERCHNASLRKSCCNLQLFKTSIQWENCNYINHRLVLLQALYGDGRKMLLTICSRQCQFIKKIEYSYFIPAWTRNLTVKFRGYRSQYSMQFDWKRKKWSKQKVSGFFVCFCLIALMWLLLGQVMIILSECRSFNNNGTFKCASP